MVLAFFLPTNLDNGSVFTMWSAIVALVLLAIILPFVRQHQINHHDRRRAERRGREPR